MCSSINTSKTWLTKPSLQILLSLAQKHCEDSKLQEGEKKKLTNIICTWMSKENKPKTLEICKIKPK